MDNPLFWLEHGDRFPYDAPDEWGDSEEPAPPPTDWAHRAARAIIAELGDRRGVGDELGDLDEEIRTEIIQSLTSIIRLASPA